MEDQKKFSEQMLSATFEFAKLAVSSLIILNGAAATALLAFIGSRGAIGVSARWALLAFALGAGVGGASSAFAYFGQHLDWAMASGRRSHPRTVAILIGLAIALVIFGYVLFFVGCTIASSAVSPLSTQAHIINLVPQLPTIGPTSSEGSKTGAMPNWMQVSTALLTPIIALLSVYIAFQQWRTNRNKLKFDLFDRRYAVYAAAITLINSILGSGRATREAIFAYVQITRSANFIVGRKIMDYLDKQLHARAVDLETHQAEMDGLAGQDRVENVRKQSEIKRWLVEQYSVIDKLFESQLRLKH